MCNFHYVYTLIESVCQLEGCVYKGYGICVQNTKTNEALSFFDISTEKDKVMYLTELCNRLELDPIHIEDVIEDLIVF